MHSPKAKQSKCCCFRKILLDNQERPLRSVLLNTLDIPITIQRGRKLGYALPRKTRYEMTENVKENEVLECLNHRDKICILRRLKKTKDLSGLVKSLESDTDDGLLSCSNFPE